MGGIPIGFTSSPLLDAGFSSVPQSTLDSPTQGNSGVLSSITSIINSVGSVVLGGLAISKLPSGQQPGITTQVQSKAGGATVTTSPSGILRPGGVNLSTILIFLIIGVLLWMAIKK
jgi:hypothetical protein